MKENTNPSIFVDMNFEMDPQYEDLLPNGAYLRDGMVVLMEYRGVRADLSRISFDEDEMRRAKRYNRWFTVSHLELKSVCETCGKGGNRVSFIAIYGDGTKQKHEVHIDHAWYVKKDSIPK